VPSHRGDVIPRQQHIDAYNAAYAAWAAPGTGRAAAFRAMGPFSLEVDSQVWANLTDATVEPVAIENGTGIAAYVERATYVATMPPFASEMPLGLGSAVRTFTLRTASGAVLWSQAITVATSVSSAARASTARDSNGVRFTTYTCPTVGALNGTRCLSAFLPTPDGICIVIDATTRAYAGGCGVSSQATATAWAASESAALG
jgi:hypothetical protein